jgi:hypothetical protein
VWKEFTESTPSIVVIVVVVVVVQVQVIVIAQKTYLSLSLVPLLPMKHVAEA